MGRMGQVAGYAAVVASCSFGALGASLWGPCVAAVLLVLLSLDLHEPIYARHARSGEIAAQSKLLLASVANAALTVSVAYAAGLLIAWAIAT